MPYTMNTSVTNTTSSQLLQKTAKPRTKSLTRLSAYTENQQQKMTQKAKARSTQPSTLRGTWVTEGGDLGTADWGYLARRCASLCLQAVHGGRAAGRPGSRWCTETWPNLRLKWPQVDGGRLEHIRLNLTGLDSGMSTWVDFKRFETFRSCDKFAWTLYVHL